MGGCACRTFIKSTQGRSWHACLAGHVLAGAGWRTPTVGLARRADDTGHLDGAPVSRGAVPADQQGAVAVLPDGLTGREVDLVPVGLGRVLTPDDLEDPRPAVHGLHDGVRGRRGAAERPAAARRRRLRVATAGNAEPAGRCAIGTADVRGDAGGREAYRRRRLDARGEARNGTDDGYRVAVRRRWSGRGRPGDQQYGRGRTAHRQQCVEFTHRTLRMVSAMCTPTVEIGHVGRREPD